MLKKILRAFNLNDSQAKMLEYLYENGRSKASEIARAIKKSRTIVYKDAEVLIELGLVNKINRKNESTMFFAEHPRAIENLIRKKEEKIKKNKESLGNIFPNIIAQYNLSSGRPGVRFYEGIGGMKEIYEEILKEDKKLYLIRTAYEPVYNQKIAPIVENFIKKRIKKKIKVTAIIPSDVDDPEKDAKWLMQRFNVDKGVYTAPVEIDIFGDKVAILSFGEELVGMIIESKQIAQSLRQIFVLATLASVKK